MSAPSFTLKDLAGGKDTGKELPPPPQPDIVQKALTALVRAKGLQARLVQLIAQYSKLLSANPDVLLIADYYKDFRDIQLAAKELRAELNTYLIYFTTKGVPLTLRQSVQKIFAILNSGTDQDSPEALLATVLSDTLIQEYMNLILTLQASLVPATGQQQVVLQIPVQPVAQGAGRA